MAKKKVFVSYDHSEDKHYKNLLKAWDANDSFDFEFDQRSPDEAINSTNATTVKATLTKLIKESAYLLVIVGKKSYESSWMTWEISKAKEADIKLKLVAVKIDTTYTTPQGLLNTGTTFAHSFTQSNVIAALNKATNSY